MLLKKKKTSNGVRHQISLKKFLLCKKNKIDKRLVKGKKRLQGRGSVLGRITVNHKGAGVKQSFRKLDSTDLKFSVILGVFYDPKRSSFVSLYYDFLTKKFGNTLATQNTFPGSISHSYYYYPQLFLSCLIYVKDVPTGSVVYNLHIGNKSTYIKSAGVCGVVVQKTFDSCKIKMPSGVIKNFPINTLCVLGSISNPHHFNVVLGKAGKSRFKNRRPTVRGVAMNPVDHPHGGQTSGGIPSVTPWGIPTKGKPTRKKKCLEVNGKGP